MLSFLTARYPHCTCWRTTNNKRWWQNSNMNIKTDDRDREADPMPTCAIWALIWLIAPHGEKGPRRQHIMLLSNNWNRHQYTNRQEYGDDRNFQGPWLGKKWQRSQKKWQKWLLKRLLQKEMRLTWQQKMRLLRQGRGGTKSQKICEHWNNVSQECPQRTTQWGKSRWKSKITVLIWHQFPVGW